MSVEDKRAALIVANLKPEAVEVVASGLAAIEAGHAPTLDELELLRALSAIDSEAGRTFIGYALSRELRPKNERRVLAAGKRGPWL